MGQLSGRIWNRVLGGLALVVLGQGCNGGGGAGHGPETGSVQMALSAQGSLGNVYRLRQGSLTINGPSAIALSSEDFLANDRIQVDLRVGDYTIALAPGYFLERITGMTTVRVDDARLTSPNPLAFSIADQTTTTVLFRFQVGGEAVEFSHGTLAVGIAVDEVDGGADARPDGAGGLGGASGLGGAAGLGGAGGTGGAPVAVCGDGVVGAGEECDDGNTDPCDGCAACRARTATPAPAEGPGVITEDTLWCGGPTTVHLVRNVVVLQGATLFVGPGVRVQADDNQGFQIRGAIQAGGTEASPVVFTSAAAQPDRGSWFGIALIDFGQVSRFDHAVVEFATTGISFSGSSCCGAVNAPEVRSSSLQHNVTALQSVKLVDSSVVSDNSFGMQTDCAQQVTNSTFQRNTRWAIACANSISGSTFQNNPGIAVLQASTITGSHFAHNGLAFPNFQCTATTCRPLGIAVQQVGSVSGSTFTNNDVAIMSAGQIASSTLVANNAAVVSVGSITGSLVTDNSEGVGSLGGDLSDSTLARNGSPVLVGQSAHLQGDTLCDSGSLQVRSQTLQLVDAASNWWCTTDRAAIDARVFDVFDDINVGPVVFDPFLSAPAAGAPADPGPPAEGPPGNTPVVPVCGDGVLDPGEQCDDGNQNPCDACVACRIRTAPPPPLPATAPGVIDADTFWCGDGQSIQVTTNVVVLQGATLFVGPGVHVQAADGLGFQVRGALQAHGSDASPVVFTSASATPAAGSWFGISLVDFGQRSDFDHAVLEYAAGAVSFSTGCCTQTGPTLRHSIVRHNLNGLSGVTEVEDLTAVDNERAILGQVETIRSSHFSDNRAWAVESAVSVVGSQFSHNGLGFNGMFVCPIGVGCRQAGVAIGTASSVDSSTFTNNDVAFNFLGRLINSVVVGNNIAAVSAAQIQTSLIADNTIGLSALQSSITGSTLVRNGTEIVVQNALIHQSTLCNQAPFELRSSTLAPIDATNTWWCTTDPAAIGARLFDVFDDINLGPILFDPFLSAPPPTAPADPGPPAEGPPGHN